MEPVKNTLKHADFVFRQLPTLQYLLDNRATTNGNIDIRIEESAVRRLSNALQESEFKLVTARLEHGMKAWRAHEAKRNHYESAVLANKHNYQLARHKHSFNAAVEFLNSVCT